jgi:hypothetical protein
LDSDRAPNPAFQRLDVCARENTVSLIVRNGKTPRFEHSEQSPRLPARLPLRLPFRSPEGNVLACELALEFSTLLGLHQSLQSRSRRVAERNTDHVSVKRGALDVEVEASRQGGECDLCGPFRIRIVPVRHGREDRELGLAPRQSDIADGGDGLGTQHQGREPRSGAEFDGLARPVCDLRARRDGQRSLARSAAT